MLQSLISIGINIIYTVLFVVVRDYTLPIKMLIAAYGGTAVLLSLVGVTSYLSTRSKLASVLAQVGFFLFVPIGLIGVFGFRKLKTQMEEGHEDSVPSFRFNPVFLAATIMAIILFLVASLSQPLFFTVRNLTHQFRYLPLYLLFAFGLIMLARQDIMDFSVPGVMVVCAIVFSRGMTLGGAAGTMLILLSLVLVCFVAFLHSVLLCETGFPSSSVTFLTLMVCFGTSLTLAQGMPVSVDYASLVIFPGSWLAVILLGAVITYALLRKTAGSFDSSSFSSGERGLFLTWTAFAAASGMSLLRGIYSGAYMGGINPSVPFGEILFLLFTFFFLRAFTPGILLKYGLLLALIPSLLWCYMSNLLALGNLSGSEAYIIKTYPALIMGVLSYSVRKGEKLQ